MKKIIRWRTKCMWCGKCIDVGKEQYKGKKPTKTICNKCIKQSILSIKK